MPTIAEQKRPVSSLVDQIPPVGYKSNEPPAAPAGILDNDIGRNLMALPGISGVARAVPTAAAGAAKVVSMLAGGGRAAAGPVAAAAPYVAPAGGFAALQAASSPAAPAATPTSAPAMPVTPATAAAARPTAGAQPVNVPLTPQAAAQSVQGAPGVRRLLTPDGKTIYTNVDGENAPTTTTPATIASSAGPTLDASTDAALSAARRAAIERGDIAAVQDSYAAQGQTFGTPARGPSTAARLREQTAGRRLNRNGAAALLDAERNDMQGQRDAVTARQSAAQTTESQVRTATGIQTLAAQQAYADAMASGDPAAIERAEQNLRAFTGKLESPDSFSITAIPGGIDHVTGQPIGSGAIRLNRRTGETDIITPQQAKGQGAAAGGKQQYVTGKVYKDANGNRAKWDGKKFVPVN